MEDSPSSSVLEDTVQILRELKEDFAKSCARQFSRQLELSVMGVARQVGKAVEAGSDEARAEAGKDLLTRVGVDPSIAAQLSSTGPVSFSALLAKWLEVCEGKLREAIAREAQTLREELEQRVVELFRSADAKLLRLTVVEAAVAVAAPTAAAASAAVPSSQQLQPVESYQAGQYAASADSYQQQPQPQLSQQQQYSYSASNENSSFPPPSSSVQPYLPPQPQPQQPLQGWTPVPPEDLVPPPIPTSAMIAAQAQAASAAAAAAATAAASSSSAPVSFSSAASSLLSAAFAAATSSADVSTTGPLLPPPPPPAAATTTTPTSATATKRSSSAALPLCRPEDILFAWKTAPPTGTAWAEAVLLLCEAKTVVTDGSAGAHKDLADVSAVILAARLTMFAVWCRDMERAEGWDSDANMAYQRRDARSGLFWPRSVPFPTPKPSSPAEAAKLVSSAVDYDSTLALLLWISLLADCEATSTPAAAAAAAAMKPLDPAQIDAIIRTRQKRPVPVTDLHALTRRARFSFDVLPPEVVRSLLTPKGYATKAAVAAAMHVADVAEGALSGKSGPLPRPADLLSHRLSELLAQSAGNDGRSLLEPAPYAMRNLMARLTDLIRRAMLPGGTAASASAAAYSPVAGGGSGVSPSAEGIAPAAASPAAAAAPAASSSSSSSSGGAPRSSPAYLNPAGKERKQYDPWERDRDRERDRKPRSRSRSRSFGRRGERSPSRGRERERERERGRSRSRSRSRQQHRGRSASPSRSISSRALPTNSSAANGGGVHRPFGTATDNPQEAMVMTPPGSGGGSNTSVLEALRYVYSASPSGSDPAPFKAERVISGWSTQRDKPGLSWAREVLAVVQGRGKVIDVRIRAGANGVTGIMNYAAVLMAARGVTLMDACHEMAKSRGLSRADMPPWLTVIPGKPMDTQGVHSVVEGLLNNRFIATMLWLGCIADMEASAPMIAEFAALPDDQREVALTLRHPRSVFNAEVAILPQHAVFAEAVATPDVIAGLVTSSEGAVAAALVEVARRAEEGAQGKAAPLTNMADVLVAALRRHQASSPSASSTALNELQHLSRRLVLLMKAALQHSGKTSRG